MNVSMLLIQPTGCHNLIYVVVVYFCAGLSFADVKETSLTVSSGLLA